MNDNFSMHCHTWGSLEYVGVALVIGVVALGGCEMWCVDQFHMAAAGVSMLAIEVSCDSASLAATVVLSRPSPVLLWTIGVDVHCGGSVNPARCAMLKG